MENDPRRLIMSVETISVHDTHDLLKTDPAAVLVCAYEKEDDFRQHDLEGAISLNEFRKRRNSIPKDESVIFYCACPHDEGAIQQAKKYQREGFTNVKVLEGGVNAWKDAGYGLVTADA
jgi:rhodanese-related sulfurtransferase